MLEWPSANFSHQLFRAAAEKAQRFDGDGLMRIVPIVDAEGVEKILEMVRMNRLAMDG